MRCGSPGRKLGPEHQAARARIPMSTWLASRRPFGSGERDGCHGITPFTGAQNRGSSRFAYDSPCGLMPAFGVRNLPGLPLPRGSISIRHPDRAADFSHSLPIAGEDGKRTATIVFPQIHEAHAAIARLHVAPGEGNTQTEAATSYEGPVPSSGWLPSLLGDE